jgi:hypothetical protein
VITEEEERAVTKARRAAVDSCPLTGAGRVEDTLNLLGHTTRKIEQRVLKIAGGFRRRRERPETEGNGDWCSGAPDVLAAAQSGSTLG